MDNTMAAVSASSGYPFQNTPRKKIKLDRSMAAESKNQRQSSLVKCISATVVTGERFGVAMARPK
jgi:hypothetical protein